MRHNPGATATDAPLAAPRSPRSGFVYGYGLGLGVFLGLVSVFTLASACSPSRPPKGDEVRLKGRKGAICLADRECASQECRGGRCTEKIEKVGLGLWCDQHRGCKKGLYCDKKAKKCAPHIECKELEPKLKRCVADVYGKFRPSQKGRLRRMGARSRRRFLKRNYRILRRILCRATRSKSMAYKRALELKSALGQKDCEKFAADFHAALKKD